MTGRYSYNVSCAKFVIIYAVELLLTIKVYMYRLLYIKRSISAGCSILINIIMYFSYRLYIEIMLHIHVNIVAIMSDERLFGFNSLFILILL